jgi:hypothetical protein
MVKYIDSKDNTFGYYPYQLNKNTIGNWILGQVFQNYLMYVEKADFLS